MFTKEKICSIVQGCAADDNPKVRLMGVRIGVSYFRLLHKKEILLVNVEDVTFNTEKNVYQVSSMMRQKTCTQNVSFNLLAYMTGGLTMYLGELQEPTGHFLKNMHKGVKHSQNMGTSILAKWHKMTVKMIKIDPAGFTGTTWHRSGTTAMTDNGESAINLKHAGGWQSDKVVQGYIAQSKHIMTA
eukprot:10282182-Ditylum_brightwellii.AAC.1